MYRDRDQTETLGLGLRHSHIQCYLCSVLWVWLCVRMWMWVSGRMDEFRWGCGCPKSGEHIQLWSDHTLKKNSVTNGNQDRKLSIPKPRRPSPRQTETREWPRPETREWPRPETREWPRPETREWPRPETRDRGPRGSVSVHPYSESYWNPSCLIRSDPIVGITDVSDGQIPQNCGF
jgi:hypothetical protein